MRIKNPIDKEVTLNYKGELYTIDANSVKAFTEEVALHWVSVFQFMTIEGDEVTTKEKTTTKEVEEKVKKEVKKK